MTTPKRPRLAFRREHTGSESQDRAQRLAQDAASTMGNCPFLVGRTISVSFTAGQPVTVDHGLGIAASCYPIGSLYSLGVDYASPLWVDRAWKGPPLANLATALGNFTVGNRFQVLRTTMIVGCRFLWAGAGVASTIKTSIWLDSSGAVLASGTCSVGENGVYVAPFTTPLLVTGNQLSVNMTAGIRDQAGARYGYTTFDILHTNAPTTIQGMSVKALNLYSAGDARPTLAAGAENYWIEPVFVPQNHNLVDVTPSTMDRKLQLMLVSGQSGVMDLWFYPSASKTIPTGSSQSRT